MLERLRRSTRARILLAFVLVLTFAGAVTTVLLRQVLLARADVRVAANLEQEVEEFRILVAEGRDPTTGKPFGADVPAIFDVFLARNVPGAGEAVLTFLEGRPYRPGAGGRAPPAIRDRVTELAASVPQSVRGELRVGDAHVRYLAVPVRVQGRRRGAFAVVGDLREAEQEAAAAGRVAAYSSAVALLFAGLLGLVVTGRTLRPLRDMAVTARSISESDLTRRIPSPVTTRSGSSAGPSIRCSTACSAPSTASGRSSRTRATNCARP